MLPETQRTKDEVRPVNEFIDFLKNHDSWFPGGANALASFMVSSQEFSEIPLWAKYPDRHSQSVIYSIPRFEEAIYLSYGFANIPNFEFKRTISIVKCIFEKKLSLQGLISNLSFSINAVFREDFQLSNSEFSNFSFTSEITKRCILSNLRASKLNFDIKKGESFSLDNTNSGEPSEITIKGEIDDVNIQGKISKLLLRDLTSQKVEIISNETDFLRINGESNIKELILDLSSLNEDAQIIISDCLIENLLIVGALPKNSTLQISRINGVKRFDFNKFNSSNGRFEINSCSFVTNDGNLVFSEGCNLDQTSIINCEWSGLNKINLSKSKFNKIELTNVSFPEKKEVYKSIGTKNSYVFKQFLDLSEKNKEIQYISKFKQFYYEELRVEVTRWDKKISLCLNQLSNSHGSSYPKAFFFILVVNVLFFTSFLASISFEICNASNCFENLTDFSNHFWLMIKTNGKYYIEFLNPTGFKSDFNNIFKTSLLSNSIFYLGKIFIGYGYYQFIKAFRILS